MKTNQYKIFVFLILTGIILFVTSKYLDPIQKANETAAVLKKGNECDRVICLSHPGYKYNEDGIISDIILARETENIDVIIGGHTHTFLDNPVSEKNKKGDDVIINQVGFAGIISGRLDFEFSKFSGQKLTKSHTITVSQKTGI